MKKFILLLAFFSFLIAEDMGGDDFDSIMDEEFKDAPVIQKKKDDLHLSFNGFFKVRGYSFLYKTHYKNRNNDLMYADSILELTGKAKKGKFLGSSTIFLMGGTDYTTYNYHRFLQEFRDINKKVPIGGIKELYILYSSDNYDVLVGKKVFKVGISTLYSPSDIYNITLAPDPLDPYTIGTWLTKFSYYKGDSEYSIVFFPFISNSKTFSEKSRWAGNDDENNVNKGDFIIPSGSEVIQDRENKVRVLLRFKTNAIIFNRGVDYMIDLGYGPSLYSILEYTDKPNVYLETKPEVAYVSTGFSTTYKKLEVHAEAYYQYSINSYDDDFISAVGGASYNLDNWIDKLGFSEVKMILEYVREIKTRSAKNKKTFETSERERAPKNDILIKLDGKISDKMSLSYFANFRLELKGQKDSGRYQKVSFNYKIKDGLNSDIFVETFNGDVNSYYGKWRKNDRIGVDLKYSF